MLPGMFEGATRCNITGGSFQNSDGDQHNTFNTTTYNTTTTRVNKPTYNGEDMDPNGRQCKQRQNEDYLDEYKDEDEPNDESTSFAPWPEERGRSERRRQHCQGYSRIAPAHSGRRDRPQRITGTIRRPEIPAPPARRDDFASQSQYDDYEQYSDYYQRGANQYRPCAYGPDGYSSSSRMHYDTYADSRLTLDANGPGQCLRLNHLGIVSDSGDTGMIVALKPLAMRPGTQQNAWSEEGSRRPYW